ncbi:uncharacterized protein A4U43_C09F1390 [Asparagus officinalis]|uniref:Uncharacterized protein n=1 Tax=Asparagus officinalis TaxID=4686 RepID=A0A5P1E7R9_ASPOF|nr:uncharacterized protein A4U43_C09F1390 [Asparagus officinalis]
MDETEKRGAGDGARRAVPLAECAEAEGGDRRHAAGIAVVARKLVRFRWRRGGVRWCGVLDREVLADAGGAEGDDGGRGRVEAVACWCSGVRVEDKGEGKGDAEDAR